MAGILNSVSDFITGSPVTNPGNAQAQNNLGVAEQARNDASSRFNTTGQNLLSQFQQLSGAPNPAMSGAYAPMMQNPNASATVSAPQIGSVYGGFNPGAVMGSTGGGVSEPNVPAMTPFVGNGAMPTAASAAAAAKAAAKAGATPSTTSTAPLPSGLPPGYNWKASPDGNSYVATDPNNPNLQITDVIKANPAGGGTGFDVSDPHTGQYDSGMKQWAPSIAAALTDFSNINGPMSGSTSPAGGGSSRSSRAA